MVKERDKSANVVHFAAWTNSYDKATELTFYNDEYDDAEPIKAPPKPRRRPARESSERYHERIRLWNPRFFYVPEVIKPGDSMRASYYTEKILPGYCKALSFLRNRSDILCAQIHPDSRCNRYTVEDNDPSHGAKNPDSLPAIYRNRNGMLRLHHPANSSDPNPVESIWNTIKERVRRRLHEIDSITELKDALQYEWSQVTMDQIRARINEMPERISKVLHHPETRVKIDLW
jgi:hypothetical protein